ncbi:MAG: PDZ domain-containing protein [Verrucomicrobiae bacterium]|nr:PDZ domain-containing protein [Verrucomicrobiae bacterium]NNJ87343.1 PDZ domain-containing protein [Akkermansiaceae bacterium]
MNQLKRFLIALVLVVATTASDAQTSIPGQAIEKLSSDSYADREQAYAELSQWASKHLKNSPEKLYQAWKADDEPEAKTRLHSLMKQMVIERKFGRGKGFVGIRMEEFMVPGKNGADPRPAVKISLVLEDTPAAKSGLKPGDIILGVDDLDFKTIPQIGQARVAGPWGMGTVLKFSDYIQSKQPDDEITLHLLKDGREVKKKIVLMKRPASADMDPFGRSRGNDTKAERDRFFRQWLKEKRNKADRES